MFKKFKNKNVLLFHVLYVLYFVAQALSYCYLITFLTKVGYTASERSIFFACSAIVGAIVQFLIGYLCDKYQTVKKYLNICFIVYAVFSVIIYFYTEKQFFVHLALVLGVSSMLRVTNGMLDSWCLVVDEECKKSFGSIRAMGSIGWALGSQFGQLLIEKFGYPSLGISFSVVVVIMMIAYAKVNDGKKEKDAPINFKDVGRLFSNINYVYVILIFFCLHMITGAQDTLVVDKLGVLGASEQTVSLYWSLSAIVELPLFFFGGKVGDKLGVVGTAAFTIIMYGVKFVLFALVGDANVLIAVSLLQFCTFPLLTIFSKSLVDDESPENMKLSGQQIATAFYSGLSSFAAPFMTGFIEDSLGIDKSLFVFAGFAVVSLLFLGLYKINKKRKA